MRGRSSVREWQIVTVASRCSSSSAIGLPTMSLRPMTTACWPASGMLLALEQLDAPERRAGHERRALLHQPADVARMKAVDVLGRVDGVEHSLLGLRAHRRGQRRLHEDGVDALVRVEARDRRERVAQRSRFVEPHEIARDSPRRHTALSLLRT